MHASRIALIIASVVGMICTFLPWASVPLLGAVYGTSGDGWFSFVPCAGAAVLALAGDRRSALSTAALIVTALCGVAAGLVGVVDTIHLHKVVADSQLSGVVSVGSGLYLLIVTGLAIAIVPALLCMGSTPARPVIQPQAYWPQQPPPAQGYWQPPRQQNSWPPNY